MALKVVPCDAPLGARIEGIQVREPLREEAFALIEEALHTYGVIVFPNQILDSSTQKAFSLRFGSELDIHPLHEFAMPDDREVFVLSNIIENGRPIGAADAAQYWHSDLSYMPAPSRVSLLYGVEVPRDESGALGDTEFAATDQAYLDLDDAIRGQIGGLRAFHDARKAKRSQSSHFTRTLTAATEQILRQVSHPIVRTHPYSKVKCLYVNEGFTTAIDGVDAEHSDRLLSELFQHMTQRKYIYTHRWEVNDLVVWDNCLTIHQGIPNYGKHQRRLMHRTIVKGSLPY